MTRTNSKAELPRPALGPAEAALVPPDAVLIREIDLDLDLDDERPTDPGPPPPERAAHGNILRTRPRHAPAVDPDERTTLPAGPNARPAPVAVEIGEPLFTESTAFARSNEPVKPAAKPRRPLSRWLPWLLTGALLLFSAIGWSVIHHGAHDTRTPAHARPR